MEWPAVPGEVSLEAECSPGPAPKASRHQPAAVAQPGDRLARLRAQLDAA